MNTLRTPRFCSAGTIHHHDQYSSTCSSNRTHGPPLTHGLRRRRLVSAHRGGELVCMGFISQSYWRLVLPGKDTSKGAGGKGAGGDANDDADA